MPWRRIALLGITTSLMLSAGQGQQQSQPSTVPTANTNSTESETSTRDLDNTIKVNVNLVLVRVVVKDSSGKVVPDLKKEDFQLFDNGKAQRVSSFSVDTAETAAPGEAPTKEAQTTAAGNVASAEPSKGAESAPKSTAVIAAAIPRRFIALVFDDAHMKVAEAMAVHAATEKLFSSLNPTDRVAIYSTEGEVQQDFTDDPATLRKTLAAIVPHPPKGEGELQCPNISYYQADLIVNKRDREAIQFAQADASVNNCPIDVEGAAQRILQEGDDQTRAAYQYLNDVVRKLTGMPGQRVLVYVSPGFLVEQANLPDSSDVIEKAVRAGVVVNTIDARGLYTTDGLPDIAAAPQMPMTMMDRVPDSAFDYQRAEGTYQMQAQFEQGQILAGMAASTGGTYFHSRNDLGTGMSQALEAPNLSYVLGFAPQSSVEDGKFHSLKVQLVSGRKYQIQARNGYYARKKLDDPEEEAKQEVREALFSDDEIVTLPMQLNTQFLSIDSSSTQLTVLTHLDIHAIRFRKADGRNRNEVVVATGVFDRNGQLVDGQMKEVALKLQDATVKRLSQTGLTFKSVFKVRPGTYNVRSVVRGAEGDQLTARNLPTVIP